MPVLITSSHDGAPHIDMLHAMWPTHQDFQPSHDVASSETRWRGIAIDNPVNDPLVSSRPNMEEFFEAALDATMDRKSLP